MLASAGRLPAEDARFGFEYKWDGIRCLASNEEGVFRLHSRSGRDVTPLYPELASMARAMPRGAVIDGEIVALDKTGRPDFGQLQRRINLTDARKAAALTVEIPVFFLAFDILKDASGPVMDLDYQDRRERLEALGLEGSNWRTPSYEAGRGEAMRLEAKRLGLEGVVAKRLDSPYRPGERSSDWIKVKTRPRQEFVVGGWTQGEGGRRGTLGALLVGYQSPTGEKGIRFAGSVGSGFTDADLDRLRTLLEEHPASSSPFQEGDVVAGAHYVEPRIVIEVEFQEWTHAGLLRQAAYKGLRSDKAPSEVVREIVLAEA